MTGPVSTHEHDHDRGRDAHLRDAEVFHATNPVIQAWGLIGATLLAATAVLGYFLAPHGDAAAAPHGSRALPPLWWIGCAPFASFLLAIAILPLIPACAGWWHKNANKLALSLVAAFATLAYVVFSESAPIAAGAATHAIALDFVPFIVLLFALFVISGGVHIEGDFIARPRTTTAILAFGTLIASVVGTTGASVLLIRPLLATISERKYRVHTVVFFIFLVSNIGGTLLPIGDPPLFMGYLRGVPFWWTLTLWKEWATCSAVLLTLYFVIDSVYWKNEPDANKLLDRVRVRSLRVTGTLNLLWLALVVATVAFVDTSRRLPFTDIHPPIYAREVILLLCAGLSMLLTPKKVREANRFSFGAIAEVAAIFVGIFVAMHVPLEVLRSQGDQLGLSTPGHFFWATGLLSSFLDNAPTYVVFLQAADVLTDSLGDVLVTLTDGNQISEPLLTAVSLGAVFMGANTYIGNGPNFMVRSIAEESGVRMPSFFGYMMWSGAILIPLFVVIHWLFLGT
ncbi:MAG: sodium:proton antiporter [Phycisphaerae bacterium]|nr:sodium:proton antiporter [Phycisphaerae bacterium]